MSNSKYDWNEFLVFARHLNEHIPGETASRVVISRAYYAAYWKARIFLEENGALIPRRSMHTFVWQCFRYSMDARGNSIGQVGTRLMGFRVRADYVADLPIAKYEAERVIIMAQRMLTNVEEISGKARQSALTTANQLISRPEYDPLR